MQVLGAILVGMMLLLQAGGSGAGGAEGPVVVEGGARMYRDVTYASPGGRAMKLDLVLPPAGEGNEGGNGGGNGGGSGGGYPLVIYVHGGGWETGSKASAPYRSLVPLGYAVASVEYRLSGEAKFPAQFEDVKAAVKFLRENAGRFGVDPKRFAALGTSAGGHLVGLLAGSGNGEAVSQVQAVVDVYGPSDFTGGWPGDVESAVSRLLGKMPSADAALTRSASPARLVYKGMPPVLILHGDQDRVVPVAQGEVFRRAIEAVGGTVKMRVLAGAGHSFGVKPVEKDVAAFLEEHLRVKGEGK